MTYTYITLPSVNADTQVIWSLTGLSTTFTSPGGASQTIARTSLWSAQIAFAHLREDDTRKLQAFMAKLLDPTNLCMVADLSYRTRGSALGAPTVSGAGQSGGYSLTTQGWTAGAKGVLLAGDMIQLATRQLLRVTDDVDADASGNATINVAPYIRTAPADGSVITTNNPACPMRIPKFSAATTVAPRFDASLTLAMQEVLV